MKYALFLGCTVPARARNYELSARKVAKKLDIEFVDMDDFACCGFPVKSVDWKTSMTLATRNLAAAESMDLDICTLCSACTSVLTECNRELEENPELRQQVNEKLSSVGKTYSGHVKVKHFARVLYEDIGIEKIKNEVEVDINTLKIASHYGCHYLKPSNIYDCFDNPEFPKTLDELVSVTGANSVDYANRKRCCGGALLGIDEDLALSMSRQKLEDIKASGADAINLVCPFCSVMYDDNQRRVERTFDVSYGLPVLYYPQLLGLAMGFDIRELGLNMNRVRPKELLAKL